jgi:hypothetical protein
VGTRGAPGAALRQEVGAEAVVTRGGLVKVHLGPRVGFGGLMINN